MFSNFTWRDFLTLTVVGSFVTVLGNFIAVYLKDVIAARSLERWKAKQGLDAIYDRYRRPICMAAEELSGRCYLVAKIPSEYEWRKSFGLEEVALPAQDGQLTLTAEANPSYYRYRVLSDAYRLCYFLGWLELYRPTTNRQPQNPQRRRNYPIVPTDDRNWDHALTRMIIAEARSSGHSPKVRQALLHRRRASIGQGPKFTPLNPGNGRNGGNPPHSSIAGVSAGQRRFRTFPSFDRAVW